MDALDKVRKLLRLSESSNANEAASAAAAAQRLIDEYHLSAALLAIETDHVEPDEPIEDFQKKGAPLEAESRDRWKCYLAGQIARSNGCRIYLSGGQIALVGRPSDADTVRYLYAYLSVEVTRLSERDGRGTGRTWRNNYRLGVVDAISKKLREGHAGFEAHAREQVAANPAALVRVNQALAVMETRSQSVERWMKTHMKLRAGGSSSVRHNGSAREAGRQAGQSVMIHGRPRGALA